MELFWEKGYGSTSIADILGRSSVNSGSLYHYFPGKQDLLIAVLDAYRDGIGPMLLDPAWAGVDDPIERIFALLARYRFPMQVVPESLQPTFAEMGAHDIEIAKMLRDLLETEGIFGGVSAGAVAVAVVVELVRREDPMVRRLLAAKAEGTHPDYDEAWRP